MTTKSFRWQAVLYDGRSGRARAVAENDINTINIRAPCHAFILIQRLSPETRRSVAIINRRPAVLDILRDVTYSMRFTKLSTLGRQLPGVRGDVNRFINRIEYVTSCGICWRHAERSRLESIPSAVNGRKRPAVANNEMHIRLTATAVFRISIKPISGEMIGSRPSDHYFRSVCLFVCLFVQSFSQPSSIRFGSN